MDEIVENFNKQNQNKNEGKNTLAFVFWLIGGILIFVDQVCKYFVFNFLSPVSNFKWLGIEKFKNFQFAFSLPVPVSLTYIIYGIVLASIIYYIFKNHQKFNFHDSLAWTLILAGATSNVTERIILGYVRDYIYILSGVFNLADGYIIVGIIILLFFSSLKKEYSSTN